MWLMKPTDNSKTCIQQEELGGRAFGMYGKVMALIHKSSQLWLRCSLINYECMASMSELDGVQMAQGTGGKTQTHP